MSTKSRRTTRRWTDVRRTGADVPPRDPAPRDTREPLGSTRPGPYEHSYDISIGYRQDRPIIVP